MGDECRGFAPFAYGAAGECLCGCAHDDHRLAAFPLLHKHRVPRPAKRALLLHGAGASHTAFTRSAPLLAWAQRERVQLLAACLPAREQRRREPPAGSVREAALGVAAALGDEPLDVVVAHSVGCWVAAELLAELRRLGRAPPALVVLAAFPPPDWPLDERPWRDQSALDDAAFRAETKAWGVADLSADLWELYGPMMRADFHLFDAPGCWSDAYRGAMGGRGRVVAVAAEADERIPAAALAGWDALSPGSFEVEVLPGARHLFPFDAESNEGFVRLWTSWVS